MNTDVETSSEVELLEALDFPVPCGHSQHRGNHPAHEGDAAFIVKYVAACGYWHIFPACAKFVNHIDEVDDWHCGGCRSYHDRAEVQWDIRPLIEE